jgi:hypothetical protein
MTIGGAAKPTTDCLSGKSRSISLTSRRVRPENERENACAKNHLSSRFKLISLVQISREKYSAFPLLGTVSSFAVSRLMQRGVRVVTIRGVRDAMDAISQ